MFYRPGDAAPSLVPEAAPPLDGAASGRTLTSGASASGTILTSGELGTTSISGDWGRTSISGPSASGAEMTSGSSSTMQPEVAVKAANDNKVRTIRIRVAVDENDVDRFRCVGMTQTRVRRPIDARDFLGIELHFFPQGAAQTVQHAALDGVL